MKGSDSGDVTSKLTCMNKSNSSSSPVDPLHQNESCPDPFHVCML